MNNYSSGDDREYESVQLDIALRQLWPQGFRPLPALVSLNGDDKLDKVPLHEWGKLRDAPPTREQVLRMRWGDANAVQTILPEGVAAIDMETTEATNLIWQGLANRGISTVLHNTHRGGHAYLRDGNGLRRTLVIKDGGGRQIGDLIAGRDHLITWQSRWHTPAADHAAYAETIADVPDVVALVREILAPHYPDLLIERANGPRAAAAPASGLLSACLERLENVSGPNDKGFYRACCPYHENGRDDLTLSERGFRCWSTNCGRHGSLRELAARLGIQTADANAIAVPVLVNLATVEPREVDWLWRLPRGRITMFDGDPDAGKSYVSLAIAADITRGRPLPGETQARQPENVLMLTAEDALDDTVRPRIDELGGDPARMTVLTAVRSGDKEQHFSLVDNLPALEVALAAKRPALLILDPINAYLGTSLDTHRDAALRSVLGPLAALADKYGVATIAIRHLTKGARDRPMYRGQGNIAYIAAARVAYLFGKNPDNEKERVMACIKNNLGPQPPSLAYEIEERMQLGEPVFRWLGETDVTPAALLAPDKDGEQKPAEAEAALFLKDFLAAGPGKTRDIENAAKAAGHTWATVRRTKQTLGVRAVRRQLAEGEAGWWEWGLPEATEAPTEGAKNENGQRLEYRTHVDSNERLKYGESEPVSALNTDPIEDAQASKEARIEGAQGAHSRKVEPLEYDGPGAMRARPDRCARCGGKMLHSARDKYGDAYSCMTCGWEQP